MQVSDVSLGSTDNSDSLSMDNLVIQDAFEPADSHTDVIATANFDTPQPSLDIVDGNGDVTQTLGGTLVPQTATFEPSTIDITPTVVSAPNECCLVIQAHLNNKKFSC